MTFSTDLSNVDWKSLAGVFEQTPLGRRDPEILRQTFTHSQLRCFVWDDDRIIGAGRALSDHTRYSVIFDVVVTPEFQGRGIGSQIMRLLGEQSKAPNILLYAVPGKEPFYARLGYRRMKTAMGRFRNPEAQAKLGYID